MLDIPDHDEILLEAIRIINGERLEDYGDPYECFNRVAKILNVLGFRYKGVELTASDVGFIMMVLKLVRASNKKNIQDSLVDICGYASLTNYVFYKSSINETTQLTIRGLEKSEKNSSSNA